MAVFYRGAGVGTYWQLNDARVHGFTPQSPGVTPTADCLMDHIVQGTVTSPFVSLTRSYGVAQDYAKNASRKRPTGSNPGYVYRIEVNVAPPAGLELWDPIVYLAQYLPSPFEPPYQHDGLPNFLLGVVAPARMKRHRAALYVSPPPGGGTPRSPNLSKQLETLVRALRDAEILAVGTIPAACITHRYDVY